VVGSHVRTDLLYMSAPKSTRSNVFQQSLDVFQSSHMHACMQPQAPSVLTNVRWTPPTRADTLFEAWMAGCSHRPSVQVAASRPRLQGFRCSTAGLLESLEHDMNT
jgi:hypothetical protein